MQLVKDYEVTIAEVARQVGVSTSQERPVHGEILIAFVTQVNDENRRIYNC